MAYRYRIYTERPGNQADRVVLGDILARRLTGYTAFTAQGSWEGKREYSIVIEVILSEENRILIEQTALDIKATFHQEAVLITEEVVTRKLV